MGVGSADLCAALGLAHGAHGAPPLVTGELSHNWPHHHRCQHDQDDQDDHDDLGWSRCLLQVLSIVQSHASTFLSLAATEYSFHHVSLIMMRIIVECWSGSMVWFNHNLMVLSTRTKPTGETLLAGLRLDPHRDPRTLSWDLFCHRVSGKYCQTRKKIQSLLSPLKWQLQIPTLFHLQNLLCNMVGARMHELVLLVRQLEVRVANWIKAATNETKTNSQQSAVLSNHQQQQQLGRRGGIKQGLSALVVGEKEEEGGVDVKRQKTKQSLEQVSGQQAFWGVSQEVVRMDTTWSKWLPKKNWIWFSIWPKRGLDLNFVWMRLADHLSNEKEEKGFDAWHKIILGRFDLLLDILPPIWVILGIIITSWKHLPNWRALLPIPLYKCDTYNIWHYRHLIPKYVLNKLWNVTLFQMISNFPQMEIKISARAGLFTLLFPERVNAPEECFSPVG